MINEKFVSLSGPFNKDEDLVILMKKKFKKNFRYIKKLGIQSKENHLFKINNELNKPIKIKTGILEYDDVQIYSLVFLQDEDEDTIIDCILE